MKLAVSSDLHAYHWPEHSKVVSPGVTDRLLDCVSVLADIRKHCVENEIWVHLFLGDLFHKRAQIGVPVHDLVVRELVASKKVGIQTIMVPGNHDQATKSGSVDAIQAFAEAGLVETVDPWVGWARWNIGGADVCGFSYCDDPTLLKKRVRACEKTLRGRKVPRIGLFHHGFEGARVGSYLEREVREPISAKALFAKTRYDVVFSGHYHPHQKIRGIDHGWYVGSPLQHVRGEARRKGFLVYDVEDRSFERVFLERPRFVSIEAEEFCGLGEEGDHFVRGNFVDVVCDKENEEHVAGLLKEAGARAWKFVRPRKEKAASGRLAIDASTSPRVALKRFLKSRREEIEGLGLDRSELLRVGLEALQEASEED